MFVANYLFGRLSPFFFLTVARADPAFAPKHRPLPQTASEALAPSERGRDDQTRYRCAMSCVQIPT